MALPNGEISACVTWVNDSNLDSLMAEANAEAYQAKLKLARKALDEYRDTSADAIAEHYGISSHAAKALCRGMKRGTKRGHLGNDYEFRNYKHF